MQVTIEINGSHFDMEVTQVKKLVTWAARQKVLDQLAGKYRRIADVPQDELAKAVGIARKHI